MPSFGWPSGRCISPDTSQLGQTPGHATMLLGHVTRPATLRGDLRARTGKMAGPGGCPTFASTPARAGRHGLGWRAMPGQADCFRSRWAAPTKTSAHDLPPGRGGPVCDGRNDSCGCPWKGTPPLVSLRSPRMVVVSARGKPRLGARVSVAKLNISVHVRQSFFPDSSAPGNNVAGQSERSASYPAG